ncbi:hypothetical protein BC828DRAFT_408198 [Blastocladiella britannica]|nr:hypothetical protein BC828DRAFT_408198 [Blastocladiella britannica]
MAATVLAPFLRATRSAVASGQLTPAWVVLGNESADLDSAVAAILYAFCLHTTTTNKDNELLAVPLLPIARADIALRTEVTAFLDGFGIDSAADLFFLEDLASLLQTSTKLALVDFNHLPPSLAHLAPRVAAVIDHHADAHGFPEASPRIVETVGSATSLVLNHWTSAISPFPAVTRAELARLAMGPIVVDTVNFDVDMGRTFAADLAARDTCAAWSTGPTVESPASLFARLQTAKRNVGTLRTADLLRKDYKEYALDCGTKYGIAAVPWDLRVWLARDSAARLVGDARAVAKTAGLHSLYIFTAFEDATSGQFGRQLAVVVPEGNSGSSEAAIVRALEQHVPDLQLELDRASSTPALPVYWVRNLKMSRKVMQPLVHPVLSKL